LTKRIVQWLPCSTKSGNAQEAFIPTVGANKSGKLPLITQFFFDFYSKTTTFAAHFTYLKTKKTGK